MSGEVLLVPHITGNEFAFSATITMYRAMNTLLLGVLLHPKTEGQPNGKIRCMVEIFQNVDRIDGMQRNNRIYD